MTFNYPKQLVTALVVFGDLIDPEYAFLREVGRPDWIFLDVGAAIGQFTVFAAGCVGGWVHAFEPSPENLATLKANIRANGIADRVSVHAVALSDQAGEAEFTTEANPFMSHLDAGSPAGGDPVRIEP
jgi:FkbM family methyltransferase